jgi:hypothetical protein
LLEAHALTAMLRAHDVEAWLFDADFVRQDWFKMIAYGGYRILVREESVVEAAQLLRDYRNGQLALAQESRAICPSCAHAAGSDDPQPRRNVFLATVLLGFCGPFVLALWKPSTAVLLCSCVALIVAYITLPWLVMRYFKWRLCCEDCGYRWRERPRHSYAELAKQAAAGDFGGV